MLKKTSLALAIATATMLAACGGGGGGGPNNGGGNGNGGSTEVSGPLDTVQNAVSDTVISPLATAAAGTPLQGVLLCADAAVNRNILDIADAFGNGLQNPGTLSAVTPEEAQAAVAALVANLSGLLNSLAGAAGCSGAAGGGSLVPETNPLAGTPLAALGSALLPALSAAQQQLLGASGSSPLSATQLASILAQLSNAFADGLDALPDEVTSAPVVGGLLATVDNALTQLKTISLLGASGASATQIASAFQALVQGVLSDLLTQVLPVADLQNAAGGGASSDLLTTLRDAVASLTAGLAGNPTGGLPSNPLGGSAFAPLSDLVEQFVSLLPNFLGQAGSGSSPLDLANGPIRNLISSLLAPLTGGTGGCLLSFLGLCRST